MEVSNQLHNIISKADEAKSTKMPLRPLSNAYRKVSADSDQVEVSGKGKLLLSLRESYKKLDAAAADGSKEVREKAQSVANLSSEEIVSHILRGTLFEII